MISSTVIVACRGPKRWFDIDAVRTEPTTAPQRRFSVEWGKRGGDEKAISYGDNYLSDEPTRFGNPAGAPPLDWHQDGPNPTGITLAEPPADGHVDQLDLPRKIVDCMCPRQVCRVCGVASERVTEQTAEYLAARAEVAAGAEGTITARNKATRHSGFGNGSGAASLINNRKVSAAPITLGWTDCGHDSFRPGVVFDPFHNPAIEQACADLGRTYLTLEVDIESSTIIVACRGAKRWFDLDAVRHEHTEDTERFAGKAQGRDHARAAVGLSSDNGFTQVNPAGAPPLDWHLDGHTTSPPFEPREGTMSLRYIVGDTRDVTATIPDGSVDLVFTSPPFLALRSYLPAGHKDKHREIGSEANPAQFLDTLLALTAEWGRVLAPHGTLAVELGDTYSGSGGGGGDYLPGGMRESQPGFGGSAEHQKAGNAAHWRQKNSGPKNAWPLAKSLAGIPQLYMIALAYGINPLTGQPSPAGRWRVRNTIHWHRPNPPVGALGDKWRPASSTITVACRGQKRWFDLDSVRHEPTSTPQRRLSVKDQDYRSRPEGEKRADRPPLLEPGVPCDPAGAPPLDWHEDGDLGTGHIILTTQPYAGSHYATFPMELPRKIIDCMCPRQVCRVCGVPRERVTGSPEYVTTRNGQPSGLREFDQERVADGVRAFDMKGKGDNNLTRTVETLGWSDCGHNNYRPGLVYDPFAGTGTTLAAAQDLGRDAIGVDIDEQNAWLARERCGMFLDVDHHERPVEDMRPL